MVTCKRQFTRRRRGMLASSIARVSAGTSTAAVARMNRRCSSRSRLSAAAIAHPKRSIRFCDQAHILSRTGVINTRLVTHLTLIVPKDCALRVGRDACMGGSRSVTFDDTLEYEGWNNSSERRVVIIVDRWNPDLSEAERAAVTNLVGAIGDVNCACELPLMEKAQPELNCNRSVSIRYQSLPPAAGESNHKKILIRNILRICR